MSYPPRDMPTKRYGGRFSTRSANFILLIPIVPQDSSLTIYWVPDVDDNRKREVTSRVRKAVSRCMWCEVFDEDLIGPYSGKYFYCGAFEEGFPGFVPGDPEHAAIDNYVDCVVD